jgi:hypothetical protein
MILCLKVGIQTHQILCKNGKKSYSWLFVTFVVVKASFTENICFRNLVNTTHGPVGTMRAARIFIG